MRRRELLWNLPDRESRQPCIRIFTSLLVLSLLAVTISGCFLLPNLAPVAAISVDPQSGHAPLTVSLDAAASSDADGIIAAFLWSFGDGFTARGTTAEHTFTAPGAYLVELILRDDDGAETQVDVEILVEPPNAPPSASFTVTPAAAVPGESVAFDASASADPDGTITAFDWSFGDGSTATGTQVEHAYTTDGPYVVTLMTTDDDGATATKMRTVLVADSTQSPVAAFAPTAASLEVGEDVHFDAFASYSQAGEIDRYEWDFGDGTVDAGVSVQHQYTSAGAYRVTLTVTDDLGGSAQASGTMSVGSGGQDPPETPPAPPADGDVIVRTFYWSHENRSRSLSVSVPADLYEWARAQPRGNWTYRDYDEYVLNPNDDSFMRTLAQSLRFSCYYRTVKNALAFVQAGITYELDPAGFEYPRYPAETLVDQAGDCEDTAILYASIVRTLGVGALIAAVDTSGDGRSDHIVAFVPVGSSYADYGIPYAWEYGGRLYAFAETATEGGYTPLGVDPWGLEPGDIMQTWDVSRVDTSPKMVKRLSPPTP